MILVQEFAKVGYVFEQESFKKRSLKSYGKKKQSL